MPIDRSFCHSFAIDGYSVSLHWTVLLLNWTFKDCCSHQHGFA